MKISKDFIQCYNLKHKNPQKCINPKGIDMKKCLGCKCIIDCQKEKNER